MEYTGLFQFDERILNACYNKKDQQQSHSGKGGGETDLDRTVAKRLATVFRTLYESRSSAYDALDIVYEHYIIRWIGPGNAYEVELIILCFEYWFGADIVGRIKFNLIEVENHIVDALNKKAFFKSRKKFVSILSGDAVNYDNWTNTENSNLIYTTALSGVAFVRIVALFAVLKNIPHIVTFSDNVKELVFESSYYYETFTRNCTFSGNSRKLVSCYVMSIDTDELLGLIKTDKLRSFLVVLQLVYQIVSEAAGRGRGTIMKTLIEHIHPTCGHYKDERISKVLTFLKNVKVTTVSEAANISFKVAQLLYSHDYITSIMQTMKDEDLRDFSLGRDIISVVHHGLEKYIGKLPSPNVTGSSFYVSS